MHTLDPHAPYAPPQRFLERIGRPRADASLGSLERLRALDRRRGRRGGAPERSVVRDVVALYDGEIAFTDVSFGALWDALRERGRDRDTLVVLLSDHGEAFWEHGRRGHGFTLYDELLRIPLVIRPPGGLDRPRRVSSLVQHVDLLPTLLDCAGVSVPRGLPGTSLRGLVEPDGGPELPDRVALSFGPASWSASDDRLELIRGRGPGAKTELYDTATDPEERRNLVSQRPTWLRAMRRRAAAVLAAHGRPVLEEEIAEVPEPIRDRLRALGYVRDPAAGD